MMREMLSARWPLFPLAQALHGQSVPLHIGTHSTGQSGRVVTPPARPAAPYYVNGNKGQGRRESLLPAPSSPLRLCGPIRGAESPLE